MSQRWTSAGWRGVDEYGYLVPDEPADDTESTEPSTKDSEQNDEKPSGDGSADKPVSTSTTRPTTSRKGGSK